MMDFFGFESHLSENEQILMESVRRWVAERVLPDIGGYYQRGEFPKHIVKEMGALGVLGIDLPEKYGCAGGSAVDYGLAMMELEYGDTGVRSFGSVQSSLVMYPIFRFGSEEQRMRYLPKLASGEMIGCFGLTEADAGSNPGGMLTRAERDGSDWVINGSKLWITNGEIADIAVVWAKTDEGLRGFIVETDTPGFSAHPVPPKMSLRASVTSELVLEECRVSNDQMLPEVVGFKGPLSCLTKARYGICWGAMGVMRSCYETALNYAKERVQFSRPIAGYQLTQDKLVNMLTELTKAQFITLQLGRLVDKGEMRPSQVSLLKRNNVSHALDAARVARTILGANGISTDYPPIRHSGNMESVLTYEGTHEIHTLIVGAEITGLKAFD